MLRNLLIGNCLVRFLLLGQILFSSLATAQNRLYDTAFTVVTVAPGQSFYLDSRFVSTFSGRSRLVVPVVLPEGTVRWYYSFSSTESKNEPLEWVSLAAQLTKIYDRTGIAAEAISRLVKPTGTAVCDVFVLNAAATQAFLDKKDDKWQVNNALSRYNLTGGTVEAVPTVGSFAIGLSNPSVKTGINVKIEISAVVAKSTPIYNVAAANFPTADKSEMWQAAERKVLFQQIKTRFDGRDDPSVSTACFCVLQKLIRNFTPDELRQRAASEQEILLSRMQKDCFSESNNVQLAIDMDNLTANKHDVDSLEKVGNLPKLLDLSRKIAATYPSVSNRSRLVRSLILTQQFAEAHQLAENLAVQNLTDLPIQLNWAHVQLFENQLDKAEQQYVKFRNQRNTEGVTWEQMVAADFKLFVRNKIFNSRYDNILKKLKIKN